MTDARPKKRHRLLKLLAALIVLCAAVTADSAYRLTVTEYELGGAPESADGFRIVQLSDLHGAEFGEDNSRLVSRVERLRPDIIALTGDFLNETGSSNGDGRSAALLPLLKALRSIAPTYFVSGNHDWASHEIYDLYSVMEEAGVVCLENRWVELRDGLVLAGVADPNGWAEMPSPEEVVASARTEYPDGYIVLLAHRNYWPEKYPDLPAELILCGHGHGGIVRLPVLGGVFGTNGEFFPEYDAGVYECGGYRMIVSRGLGNSVSLPRFLNPPEIVLAELTA